MTIKEKFKENPLAYYGLSIAASWAGVGSLMNRKYIKLSTRIL